MARAKRLKGTVEDYLAHGYIIGPVFEALCERPYGLTKRELMTAVYGGRKEPEWADSSVSVCISRFNRLSNLNRWGLQIRGHGGPGSKYLIWVHRAE